MSAKCVMDQTKNLEGAKAVVRDIKKELKPEAGTAGKAGTAKAGKFAKRAKKA